MWGTLRADALRPGIKLAYFLFQYKYIGPEFDITPTSEQSLVANAIVPEQTYNDDLYLRCYDKYFRFISSGLTKDSHKIPSQYANEDLQLTNLRICFSIKQYADLDTTIQQAIRTYAYTIKDNIYKINKDFVGINITSLKNDLFNKIEPMLSIFSINTYSRANIEIAIKTIIKCIELINNFSKKKYGTDFIKDVEADRFEFIRIGTNTNNRYILTYNIDMQQYKPNIQSSNTNINPTSGGSFYRRYHNTKSDYVSLSNLQ